VITTDIEMPGVHVWSDIGALPFPSDAFDAIICFHVLEHIPDDRKAMKELRRVLRPDGVLFCHVPLSGKLNTFEDPNITSPSERRRHFGQEDHVRFYGADIIHRLWEAGFQVVRKTFPEPLIRRFGLRRDEIVHICRPRAVLTQDARSASHRLLERAEP
jgi:SAM-dependent methyltransferase